MRIQSACDDICLLCGAGFAIGNLAIELRCKHLFHEQCFSEWSLLKSKCPCFLSNSRARNKLLISY